MALHCLNLLTALQRRPYLSCVAVFVSTELYFSGMKDWRGQLGVLGGDEQKERFDVTEHTYTT